MGLFKTKTPTTALVPRRNPARYGFQGAFWIWVLLTPVAFFAWRHTMTKPQQEFVGKYIEVSFLKSVSPHISRKVNEYDLQYAVLSPLFDGRSAEGIVIRPIKIWGGFLIAFLAVGSLVDARILRMMRAGIKLRGPTVMTVDEFNKGVKGKALTLLLDQEGSK